MTITKLIKAVCNRVGFDVSRMPPPYRVDYETKKQILANHINLVLDVGGYRGSYGRMLRESVGYRGSIVSFEPCAASFTVLSEAMRADRNWRGFQIGLSDSDTTAVLHTYADQGNFNSLLHLRDQDAKLYRVDGDCVPETIQLRKLDSIWQEVTAGLPDPKVLLKIDTQGHDAAVVRGAIDNLKNIRVIQTEMAAVEIYDGMQSMSESLEELSRLGYQPVGFYPVNTPDAYGITPEFDVLLKRYEGPAALVAA